MAQKFDILIIGAGIIGLSIARALKAKQPGSSILIIDKEGDTAVHASGRNSGVLHSGFYYTADSMKARFTIEGNRAMKAYCRQKDLPVNECGKLVVAQDEEEHARLLELLRRGQRNGSDVELIDVKRAEEIEPNVRSYRSVLYSPETASVDPVAICRTLKDDLTAAGVEFRFNVKYLGHTGGAVHTNAGDFETSRTINCAGLYADKIAHDFGFGRAYTVIPFKGLYLKYTKNTTDVRTNIYPVPDLRNPFLGVHFTKTVDGGIKIGPTAIPALWRENYDFQHRFNFKEFLEITADELKMLALNSFGFRDLAWDELRKYNRKRFIALAGRMVKAIDPNGFTEFTNPGIRAQLLDKRTMQLVQDFVIEGDGQSTHVLNAVSPAFTCAFPFAEYLVSSYIIER
jgi:L-2-hydroxyglutarate oxidase LhgO